MAEHIGDRPELADITGSSHHVGRGCVAKAVRSEAGEAGLLDEDLQSPVEASGHDRAADVRGDEEVVVLPLRPGHEPFLGLILPVARQRPEGLVVQRDHASRTSVLRLAPHRTLANGYEALVDATGRGGGI